MSKNHPALGGGIGLWLYELAGVAEDSTPDALILRPLRETLEKVGSADLSLTTPAGNVNFSWRYIAPCKDVHVAGGFVAGPWQTSGFEANVTIPLQMPTNPQIHIPLPASKWEGLGAAVSATQDGIEIREAGCNCTVWPAQSADSRQASGVLSLYLATSSVAARLGQGADTVVLVLASGSFSFHVGTHTP